MTRSDLLKRLEDDHPDLSAKTLRRVVDTFFSEVTEALAEERRVELRNFGAFSVKRHGPRTARNPKTGAAVQTSGTTVVRFRTGKRLHDKLNSEQERS